MFNEYGYFQGTLPAECVADCTTPGQDASESVEYWRKRLNFTVPRDRAIAYLREFGAWPVESNEYDKGLTEMSDDELAARALWIACGEIKEKGEWCGVVH